MSSLNGQIALQAGVDVQTRHDLDDVTTRQDATEEKFVIFPGAPKTNNADVIRVNENELVFRVATGKNNFGNGMDNAIPVTSNLNGYCVLRSKCGNPRLANYPVPVTADTEDEILYALAKDIRFVGQALQTTNPMSHEGKRLHCTALIHGTTSVFHNGNGMLHVGDTMYWALPTAQEIRSPMYKTINSRYGIHPEKVTLKTTNSVQLFNDYQRAMHHRLNDNNIGAPNDVPHRLPTDEFLRTLMQLATAARALRQNASVKGAFTEELLKDMFNALETMFTEAKRREIGKVIRGGRPGTLIDVLLGSS